MNQIQRIAVIGAGIMGHGFALVFAGKGYAVNLHDTEWGVLKKAMAAIRDKIDIFIANGLMKKKEKEPTLSRITPTADLEGAVRSADFVLEAVPERMELKKEMFRRFDQLAPPHAILASNTSALSITEMGAVTRRPEKTVIIHGINPPHIIPFVEIVRGQKTSDETAEIAYGLMKKAGKIPVRVQKEAPGFLFNRLHLALYREALYCLENGIAAPEDIDLCMTAGFAFRGAQVGPIAVSDFGGLDTFLFVCQHLFPSLSDAQEPPGVLKNLVAAGKLGTKTGAGFYNYPPGVLKRRLKERDQRLLAQLKLFRSLNRGR